jgi:hypothetical protein
MKRNVLSAFCCMALLAGCQQADEIEELGNELPMSVEASIVKTMGSRYAVIDEDPNQLSFADGNAIGMAVEGEEFVEWTLNGSTWTPTGDCVYWPDKNTAYKFNAFYPFADVTDEGGIKMPSLSGQDGTMATIATKDFLAITKSESYVTNNGVVSFTEDYSFKHVSALVKITLKGEGDLLNTTINNIMLKGNDIISTSTYKFSETGNPIGVVEVAANETGDEISISPENCTITAEGEVFYFIVNAGTITLDNVSLIIKYTSGGKIYTATLAQLGTSAQKFESGVFYTYGLKVADGILSISGNTISGWGDGQPMGDIVINGVQDSNNQGGSDEGD